MLNKLKLISSVVFFLFLGASLLQSLSPLVISEINAHHDGEVMACNMDGDCSGSCSLDGKKACSCNYTSSDNDSNNTKLCGCDHHGEKPIGTNAPFQIKAPLVSVFAGITLSPTSIFPSLTQQPLFVFTDDIFHPPRLRA